VTTRSSGLVCVCYVKWHMAGILMNTLRCSKDPSTGTPSQGFVTL